MSTDKNVAIDWEQRFPFITGSEIFPYQIILLHASSAKHLDEMLREWLGPYWKLSAQDRESMMEHWKRYYQPYADPNARRRDALFMERLRHYATDVANGVTLHYAKRLQKTLGMAHFAVQTAVPSTRIPRRRKAHRTYVLERESGDSFVGTVHAVSCDDPEIRSWYVVIELTNVIEAKSWSLSNELEGGSVLQVQHDVYWDRMAEEDRTVGICVLLAYKLDGEFTEGVACALSDDEVARQLAPFGWAVRERVS